MFYTFKEKTHMAHLNGIILNYIRRFKSNEGSWVNVVVKIEPEQKNRS